MPFVFDVIALPIFVVLVAVSIAAITDIWKFKVHNLLTLPLLVSGLIYHGAVDGVDGFVKSLIGVLFGFAVLIFFYLLGGMGGGDVKLLAAVGAWLRVPLTFYVFIAASLAAGLYAIIVVFLYGTVGETWVNLKIAWYRLVAVSRHLGADDRVEQEVNRPDRRGRVIPFAAMVALGLVGTLLWIWSGGLRPNELWWDYSK
jgi:prepilin peptidase CpaA